MNANHNHPGNIGGQAKSYSQTHTPQEKLKSMCHLRHLSYCAIF